MKSRKISDAGLNRIAQELDLDEAKPEELFDESDKDTPVTDIFLNAFEVPENLAALLVGDKTVTEDDLTEWCEVEDCDLDKVRAKIYELGQMFVKEFLHSGYSFERQVKLEDISFEELKRGLEVEYEHTSNPLISLKIACDHLSEYSETYYTRLAKMEDDAKKAGEGFKKK